MYQKPGGYFFMPDESLINRRSKYILTDTSAIHLKANFDMTDVYGKEHKAGEEWLVTRDHTDWHIRHVNEELVRSIKAVVLSNRQYVYVQNPKDKKGKSVYGIVELRKGPLTFFL